MPETISNKTDLRHKLLADRQAITAEVRNEWNAAICARLIAWWELHPVRALGVYSPIKGEPDLQSAYVELITRGVQLGLPVVVARNAPLRFIEWKPGDAMTKDAYGVLIPAACEAIQPQALLIPCVGFNEQRYRLGYGGGFYDRTLAVLPRPFAAGVSYACALTSFNADAHDVALDMVITEASLIEQTDSSASITP